MKTISESSAGVSSSLDIISIESIDCPEGVDVYDITVEEEPSFVAEGVIVHNCPQCMALDGRTFPVDEGPRPPAHAACRCSMAPVTKSFRELGFDIDELPPSTRASMNGQVPETMTYNQWLRSQVNQGRMDLVEEALGKTRAKLFAAGGLKVSSFTNRRGQTLTLKQLRGKERDVFERLGVEA